MGYLEEEEGEVGRETAWLVGREVDMSGQAEQELGKGFGKKDEREFEVEAGKIEGWKFGGTQDLRRYVYPVRKVNDGEKNVGKEVDTCIQAEQEFGNGVDNGVAGGEFH